MTIEPAPRAAAMQKPPYRQAIQITDEMRQHCHIYLDEELYSSALTLLSDLVTSGASHPDFSAIPAFTPVPFHIELISALLIHPHHTTQAPLNEHAELASRSITLLRNILSILGPLNAKLGEAFSLSPISSNRSSRRSRIAVENQDDSSNSDPDDAQESMRGVIANKGRIRTCAKDFWHMVGWALNCSVKYPKRWKYWKIWLEYMLDVLDADWKERDGQDSLDDGKRLADDDRTSLRKCLLVTYLSDVKGRSSAAKRVIRSAFADGSLESMKEFPEVFSNETRGGKVQNGQKRKREDPRGRGYNDGDAEDLDFLELPDQTPELSQDRNDLVAVDPWLGGTESIALRQRLITLFSRVSAILPDCFGEIADVYQMIYECIKPLPVPAFSLLLSPSSSSELPIFVFVSLTRLLLSRYLSLSAPRPQSVMDRDDDDLSQEVLEQCFLPFQANTSTITDNAKVSVLVEIQFRQLLKSCICFYTPKLDSAINKGILARENKIKGDKRRKDNGIRTTQEEIDLEWLRASGERLRGLLAWVKQGKGFE